jgi:predicted MFS family arabinose efflux permease
MSAVASTPGALRLFALSIVARLPLTMLSIGLLVHARHLTGSFAAAGLVTGAYGVALGVGGPLLGQLVDRRGQAAVLVGSAAVAMPLLGATAALPVGAPVAVIVALAAGIGLATPPVGACVRALFPALVAHGEALRAAYSADAAASELTWIAGPPLALALGALWSTGAALAVAGVVLVAATVAFAAQPTSRAWRPAGGERHTGSALRAPAMRTLVMALVAVGALFGTVEVAITAAATHLGSTAAAGPLLGIWGVGSLVGGVLATRLGGGARGAKGLVLVLSALTAGHLLLIPAAGNIVALGAVLLAAGAAIAPTYATVYAMVDDAAPAGTVTEAFAWLATAIEIGASAGVACAGALVDGAGPVAAIALAGGAGAVAVLVTALRSWTLAAPRAPAPVSA